MFPLGQWSASTLRKGEKSVADAGVKLAPMSSFKVLYLWPLSRSSKAGVASQKSPNELGTVRMEMTRVILE